MLDGAGYITLVDFGFAKVCRLPSAIYYRLCLALVCDSHRSGPHADL